MLHDSETGFLSKLPQSICLSFSLFQSFTLYLRKMKLVQQFIFLKFHFAQLNYVAGSAMSWLLLCAGREAKWTQLWFPVRLFLVVSGSCPGMHPPAAALKCPRTQSLLIVLLFFYNNNPTLFSPLPLTDFCFNMSDLREFNSASVRQSFWLSWQSLSENVCLCAYKCSEMVYVCVCVVFPALLALLWDMGHIYLGRQCVISQGDKWNLFG